MLCQNCNENEATVRYTEIINGEKKEFTYRLARHGNGGCAAYHRPMD